MAHPARQRRVDRIDEIGPHMDEGGRARPAIEELVAAPHGEFGCCPREIERHRAGAVSEIPDHHRPGGVGAAGDVGHVMSCIRPVR